MRKLLSHYGMVLVLLGLCVIFSVLTLKQQIPAGQAAVAEVSEEILQSCDPNDVILTVGAFNRESARFAEAVGSTLQEEGFSHVQVVTGRPHDLRAALDRLQETQQAPVALATTGSVLKWRILELIPDNYPDFASCRIISPKTYWWPDFLKQSNLLAVVDRIVVIAIIAIGMTMVIITGGIDLSVGSLIALSAVTGTLLMKMMGGLDAAPWVVALGFGAGILSCGMVGGLGGFIVTRFKVAPFISTLGIMMMARGLAFMITGGFSIYQVPQALPWLGQGRSLGLPNTVLLLAVLYLMAHVFMTHTRLGRHIYAVGGNPEAARLSGVPMHFVFIFVYGLSGLAAGLGGCIQASQLNTGTPNMGLMYELYVIAAVVVGGTSLSGGSGRFLGTLIGAFIISVIQNGMNLLGIESYTQQVVLGAVILGAVLLDKMRSQSGTRSQSAQVQMTIFKPRLVLSGLAVVLTTAVALQLPWFTAKPKERGKIGVTCMALTNPFFKLIANVMQQEAAQYGYEIVALSGDMDAAKQNNQLSDFVAQNYDAIFLNPVDSKTAGEGVKKAYEAGIPVFTYDVQVTDQTASQMITSHIGSDNYQGGRLAGESMMAVTGDRGEVAMITCPEITSCVYRAQGFKDYLNQQHSSLRIVTELSGKAGRTEGYAVATDILQAHPNIVGIFAINDPSALGAYAAVVKAGKTDQIQVIGFDASPAGKQAVFARQLYDSPQQFPRKMAQGTVSAFVKYLEGEALSENVFIPCSHYRYDDSVNDASRVAEQW